MSYWFLAFYEGLKEYTQIHQCCDNQSSKLLRLCYHEKVPKSVWMAQRYPEFLLPLVQSCAKSAGVMSGNGGQEWASKLVTNIEQVGRGCKSHNVCDWF